MTDRTKFYVSRAIRLTAAARPPNHRVLRFPTLVCPLLIAASLGAQEKPPSINPLPQPTRPEDDSDWKTERSWLTFQANFIRQQHSTFTALYSGPNSLAASGEHDTSRVETLYSGVRLTKNLEFIFDLESAGGFGLSNALGVAGFPNVDVVRNPTLGEAPYVSRVMLHYTVPLSEEFVEVSRNPESLASRVPERRLELRLGKMSTVDFFDLNAVGSDSHLQFMNWAAVNNGAYDYAADTRGYTYGLLVEYYDKAWVARFGEMLMPTVANGITLDWNIARAAGQNFELEYHPALLKQRSTVVRGLTFLNRANMGSYAAANAMAGTPDITLTRRQGRTKYGFGLNAEQELSSILRAFGRVGWNDGRNESFAYTEIDNTVELGTDLRGRAWRRAQDKLGAAFISNGISSEHARYLALGGLGFILGDGGLRYGREEIFEAYYTVHLWRGTYLAADVQRITNPGYNQDRGPLLVPSIRLHVEDGFTSFHREK